MQAGARCRRGSPRRCLVPSPRAIELAIKLAIAVTIPGVDVGRVIQSQRTASMAALQDYTRLKRAGRAANPVGADDLAWSLVLDSLVFAAEAEIRWLDHCEARLRRAAIAAGDPTPVDSGVEEGAQRPSRNHPSETSSQGTRR